MALHLSPEIIEAQYNLLKVTLPFRRWKLPHSDDIEFRVSRALDCRAWHEVKNFTHIIAVSARCVSSLQTLAPRVGHEMIHVHQLENKSEPPNKCSHNAEFLRLARQACRHHGWDEADFL